MTIVNSYTWYYKFFFFKIPFHSNLNPPPHALSVFHPIPLISFLIKKIWSISMTFKMKFVSFRNETKSYIFPWDIFKCDTISFLLLLCFNSKWNFSILWLKWTEAMEMKHNQTFFHGTYWNLTQIFISRKILIGTFQLQHKREQKQIKEIKSCETSADLTVFLPSTLFKCLVKSSSW